MESLNLKLAPAFRIIVADDYEWIREILVAVVHATLPHAVVFETDDGLAALEEYHRNGCDFLISNHFMLHLNGDELVREVRRSSLDLPILMIDLDSRTNPVAMSAGANWFLTKSQITEGLPRLLLDLARTRAKVC